MAGIAQGIYNTLIRRNYIFLGVIFGSTFAFEMGFDTMTDRFWDWKNQGRQWKDIRSKYISNDEP